MVFGKAAGFGSNIDLSNLGGSNGFKLSGAAAYDRSGFSVASAGDVNGDGFADLIVGANGADPHGRESGASYVVFGKAGGFASNIDLSSLDGSNGFKLSGVAAYDRSGFSVASAGDVNGDGFADLIVGAQYANGSSGASYVVFGKAAGFDANIDLSGLNGTNGFRISGAAPGNQSGFSVASAGDVNGDGFDDVIVGARLAGPHGAYSGASYVVFGKAGGFGSNIDLSSLDGTTGFKLSGEAAGDFSGFSVASAGDLNGDGLADLIVGAFGADPHGDLSGTSYVVFGRQPDTAVVRVGTDVSQTLVGGAFHDVLVGQGGDDRLLGNGDSDTLDGGTGNDVLNGGTGDDSMSGGTGDDTYYVDSTGDTVFESAGQGTDTVHTTVSFALSANVEHLVSDSATDLTLTGNELANTIEGGAGNDQIFGGAGIDTAVFHGNHTSYQVTLQSDGSVTVQDLRAGSPDGTDTLHGIEQLAFADLTQAAPTHAPPNIDLSGLNGTNGFRLSGAAPGNQSGVSVASAGDVNGDGFGDLIVGAYKASPNGLYSGASYVVFGKAGGLGANVDLSSLDGTNGFRLSGAAASDFSGWSVASAGDVNGDGFADLIVSAHGADPHGSSSGAAYVVFGKASGFASNIDLSGLNGTTGFMLSGAAAGDFSGFSVASAGDVNGDGFADLIVNAHGADPHGSNSGTAYVVFGKAAGFASNIDLSGLDGSNGFKLSGAAASDYSGYSVASAGDVNGDGIADLIVGAPQADPHGGNSGASYVVFGKAGGFAPNLDLSSLDGTNGFKLSGVAAADVSGISVASAGDVNGDGIDDLIVGARGADPHGSNSGASYVVFGKATGLGSNIDLSSLDGSNGFKLSGVAAQDYSGWQVASAGDVNGDGFDDLIVGAPFADPNGTNSGASYVVFGKAAGFGANLDLASLDGSNGFKLSGAAAFDYGGRSVASAGDLNGDGLADLIVGAFHADANGTNSGASYVVYSRQPDTAVVRVGTDASQTLAGGAFDDTLSGLGGDDKLYGNGGNDLLNGGSGDDELRGGTGIDVMIGGTGDDTYYVDNAADAVAELPNQGIDTVHTTVSYALAANVEILISDTSAGLTLTGNTLDNTITGGAGNDRINGGKGADHMNGGAGNDSYVVDNAGDLITDTSGTDTVIARIDTTLGSGLENLRAGSANGLILTGNDLANKITGGDGDDTLTGGLGKDTLTGGAGDDVFKYLGTSDSGATGATRDTITDFNTGDKIDLSAIDAIDGGGHDTFSFIGSGHFTAAGQVRVTTTAGGDTLVQANTGGTNAADFSVLLKGSHTLSAADFVLS